MKKKLDMDDSERIEKVLLALRMDAEALGKSIGKSDGDTIRNIIKRKYGISPKVAKAIEEKHNISFEWLRVGTGDMFKNSRKSVQAESDNASSEDKERIINEKERVIKLLEDQIAEQNDRIAEQKEIIKYQDKCIEELTRSDAQEPGEKDTG